MREDITKMERVTKKCTSLTERYQRANYLGQFSQYSDYIEGCMAEQSGFNFPQWKQTSLSSRASVQVWGQPSLLSRGYWGALHMNLYIVCAHRSLLDNFLPSSSHVISGVGLPDATHFRNTDGPGCRVSSLNACRICGGSTTKKIFIHSNEAGLHMHIYIHKLYAQNKCLLKKTLPYEMSTYIDSSATISHRGPIAECLLHCHYLIKF
jgi:hypothetical protein